MFCPNTQPHTLQNLTIYIMFETCVPGVRIRRCSDFMPWNVGAQLPKFLEEVSKAVGEHLDWMTVAEDGDKWKQFEDPFLQFRRSEF